MALAIQVVMVVSPVALVRWSALGLVASLLTLSCSVDHESVVPESTEGALAAPVCPPGKSGGSSGKAGAPGEAAGGAGHGGASAGSGGNTFPAGSGGQTTGGAAGQAAGGKGQAAAGGSAAGNQGTGGASGQAAGGSGGQGPAGSSGQPGSGQAGSGQAGSGQAGSGQAGSGQAGSGQAGSGNAGSGNAGSGQAGSGQAGSGQGGATSGLPTYPYCYCINHTFAENEFVHQVNGYDATAHYTNGLLLAHGDADQSFKPGSWLKAGGYPDPCSRRFAQGDPATGWTPPAPLPGPAKLYNDGELVCDNPDQGLIFARLTPDGRRYLCRSFHEAPAIESCQFVPQDWASGVCSVSEQDTQQFDTFDPTAYRPCDAP
jgi:hypothetical protein